MTAMSSFHSEKCCHLVSEWEVSGQRQILIGCHLESATSNRKSNSVNWCTFTWRKFPPNCIPIRVETTEP